MSRRILSTRPGSDGHFKFPNLPAGDYLIAAVTDVKPDEWYDPAFLAQLVGASTKVTLAEGEKRVQSLRTKGGGQYSAVSFIAFSTSAELGRMTSSRSGQ